MHKQTKACSIPKHVKDAVWERDKHRCIICGSAAASPCAHYIARSHGGLGIEQNIVTLCADCHRAYDQSASRGWYREQIRAYLQAHYPNWNESKLVYHKYD
jgi:5-methylcytosine-specific restriction endonuclease McrA